MKKHIWTALLLLLFLCPVQGSDVIRMLTRVDQIDGTKGTVGSQAYTGKGVIVAVIDGGFDFQHPAYQDSEGHTRIKAFYSPFDENGTAVTTADGRILPGSVYTTTEQIASLTTDFSQFDHGTHTSGIAVGTLSPQGYGGMATEADIVLCTTYQETAPVMGGATIADLVAIEQTILHTLDFLEEYARQHADQRMVVNISQGLNYGPHDGSSPIAQAIERLSQRGIVFVLSSGNEGKSAIFVNKTFESDADTLRTMLPSDALHTDGYTRQKSNVGARLLLTQMSYDENDDYRVHYTTLWSSPLVTLGSDTCFVKSSDDEALAAGFNGEVQLSVTEEGNRTHLSIIYCGEYLDGCKFELALGSQAGTEMDIFNAHFTSDDRPGYTDAEVAMTMGDWCTAPSCISVGNYMGNTTKRKYDGETKEDQSAALGDIAASSSSGVGLNGIQVPTVSAPGENIVSSSNRYYFQMFQETPAESMTWGSGYYNCMGGTSQAAPAVSGIIALWLQADPQLTPSQLKDIIKESCTTDSYTEASPLRFGYGKIDARKGLELVLEQKAAGIDPIGHDQLTSDYAVYDLQGRRVATVRAGQSVSDVVPQNGIYIVNGKKHAVCRLLPQ